MLSRYAASSSVWSETITSKSVKVCPSRLVRTTASPVLRRYVGMSTSTSTMVSSPSRRLAFGVWRSGGSLGAGRTPKSERRTPLMRLSPEEGLVKRGGPRCDRRPGEVALHPRPRGTTHTRAQLRLGQEPLQAGGQRLWVARWNEEARLAIRDGVGDPADGRADHGPAAGHRFQRGKAERLVPRGCHRDVACAVEVAQDILLLLAG